MNVHEYLVTLGIRPAELSGLKELPSSTKDALTPLVLIAPWMSTSPLSRALEKFEISFPDRDYIVDIDSYYSINNNMNEAKEQWSRIHKIPADINTWWDLLESFPRAHPCLLMAGQSIEGARDQITWAREHNRTFCLRMNLDKEVGSGVPYWMPELIQELSSEGVNDYAVVFEFGWVRDPLLVAAQVIGHFERTLHDLSTEIPVAISCTSFPKDFTIFDGLKECHFSNRELIEEIKRSTNYPKIIYGDWGSTKPRMNNSHASPPKKRIDYPTDTSWVISRDQENSLDLREAAKRVVSSEYWSGNLGIWGEQMIEATAQGLPFSIESMPKMYATRINIHLHLQAFYGHLPPPKSLDEEWVDE